MNTRTIFARIAMLAMVAAVAMQAPAQERLKEQPKPTTRTLIEQLGHRDFEQREEAERQLLDRGMAARPQLERALKDHEDAEVRWRAQRILRKLDRPDRSGGLRRRQPGDQPGDQPEGPPHRLDRVEDVDRLFDEVFRHLERDLHRDMGDIRQHLERAHSRARSRAQDLDKQIDSQSQSMKMSITPDGVRVEVEAKDRDGKVQKKTYEAKDMEAFKKAHPDVVKQFGIGGSGIQIFRGGVPDLQDFGLRRWSWPRQDLDGRIRQQIQEQLRRWQQPPVARLFDQDPLRRDIDRDEVRDMPPAGERLGIYASAAPAGVAEFLGLEAGQGLRVEEVIKGSLAEALGIQKGDILFQVGDCKIFDVGDVRKALRQVKAGETVGVQVNRRGRVQGLEAKKPAVREEKQSGDEETEGRPRPESKKLKQRGKLR